MPKGGVGGHLPSSVGERLGSAASTAMLLRPGIQACSFRRRPLADLAVGPGAERTPRGPERRCLRDATRDEVVFRCLHTAAAGAAPAKACADIGAIFVLSRLVSCNPV